jgi:DnaJ-class molecular chaperone
MDMQWFPPGFCFGVLLILGLKVFAAWLFDKSDLCSLCQGFGYVQHRFETYDAHPCPSCNGSGRVTR